ncbi:MAG: response regulator transcription factor [Clostridia bacterium]|nr:response regulator transcription factor [Clostridia bacterium]
MPETTQKKKVLVVEDEKNIAMTLAYNLMKAGYAYDLAFDGEDGLKKALTGTFDLILLDLMLPKMDGFEVCRRVREKLATPIIIATARVEEVDKIMGLDIGADDYVTKPFSMNELLARIKANIRRSSNEMVASAAEAADTTITIRGLVIDTVKYQVTRDGEPIELTKKEYELLTFMAKNQGNVYSREQLLAEVWGYDGFYGDTSSVDVTVSRLRAKLEADAGKPEYLFTKRGMGYYIK